MWRGWICGWGMLAFLYFCTAWPLEKTKRCAVFGGREMGCRGWKAPSVLCAQSLTEGRREVMAFLRQGMQRMLFVTYASSEMLKW